MQLVVISYPKNLKEEDKVITLLFENGMEYFHLRKPDNSTQEVEELLAKIPEQYHEQIILHGNRDLMSKFKLGGVHIREKDKANMNDCEKNHSIAIHDFEELFEINKSFQYALLSPVFDSISKEKTKSNFDLKEIKSVFAEGKPKVPVFALGGINKENVAQIKDVGFDGAAVLGYLWKDYEAKNKQHVIDKFNAIKELCR